MRVIEKRIKHVLSGTVEDVKYIAIKDLISELEYKNSSDGMDFPKVIKYLKSIS